MKSNQSKMIILFLIIMISNSCNKNDLCPPGRLELNISSITLNWLKPEYSAEYSEIVFSNNNGEEKIFRKDTTIHREHEWNIRTECDNGETKLIKLLYERISRVFVSDDSLRLSIATNLVPEECQWNGKNNTRMSEAFRISVDNLQDDYINLGFINIITNSLDANEITDWCGDDYTFYDSYEFAGTEYQNTYGRDSMRTNMGDVFYLKESGIIGYIDKDGSEWKIKN